MTLLDRLEALKAKLVIRDDADLVELVQILIDGPDAPAPASPAAPKKKSTSLHQKRVTRKK